MGRAACASAFFRAAVAKAGHLRATEATITAAGPAAAAGLAVAARCGARLRALTLDAGHVDATGLAAACPTLRSLVLGGSGAGGAALVAAAAPTLASLELLPGCSLASPAALPPLPRLRALTGTGPGGPALAAACPSLTRLSLAARAACAATLAPLRAAPGLADLTLHCPRLDTLPAGMAALTRLDVRGCALTDAGLSALAADCPRLVSISFRGCVSVSDAGVRALAAGAAAARGALASVDARDCPRLSDAGLERAATAVAGTTSTSITLLVGGTGAGDGTLEALARGVKGRARGAGRPPTPLSLSLDVTCCARTSPAALRALAAAGALAGATRVSTAHAGLLLASGPCAACGASCAAGGGCSGAPVQLLARAAGGALQTLALDGAPLSAAAARALATHCPALASLSAVASPRLSDAGLVALSALTGLTRVALGGGGPRSAWSERGGVAALAPRLRSLSLSGRPALTDNDVSALLGAASRLTELTLAAAPRASDAGLTPLPPTLRRLVLACCDGVAGSFSVSPLTELRLPGCGGVAARALARAVAAAPTLRVLELPPHVPRSALPAQARGAGHLAALEVMGGGGG